MAKPREMLFSNWTISIVAALLMTGILLDGKLYNNKSVSTGIFNLPAPVKITVSRRDSTIMTFAKYANQWRLTRPAVAPLNSGRVKILLDSNRQTSRNYAATDLPLEELFADPIILEIDGKSFQLGVIEPVSKQRYVLANNRVYLQADHVVPLIRSGTSPFLDLSITGNVKRVTINESVAADKNAWSSLKALGIVPRMHITSAPVDFIEIIQPNNQQTEFQYFSQEGVAILASPDSEFGYLISSQQAQKLGLE